jgi:HSP20 family protein
VDVEETDMEVIVKADLPGVDPKDLDVSVLEGALIIHGRKKEEKEEKAKNFHRVESHTRVSPVMAPERAPLAAPPRMK